MKNIWFNRPNIGWREKLEILKVLNSGWISTGKKVKEFEYSFLKYLGLRGKNYAQATNSCTAAMHLALLLEGIGPGDEVIVPSITFPATANVVEHVGARVVFCDVEKDTLNIDIDDVKKKITERTKAIIPVSLYGHPYNIEGINNLLYGKITIIQDNAHAIESRYRGTVLPEYANYSCYSFYATKNMTTAEGGMLIVDSEEKRAKAEMLCLHGLSKDAWKRYQATGYNMWDLEMPGWKYNMTDIAAAMGLCQLRNLDKNWEKRKEIVKRYRKELNGYSGITLLYDKPAYKNAYHLFPIIFNDDNEKIKNMSQEQIIRVIEKEGIGVGVHFPCLPLTKYYREKYGYNASDFPVASKMTEKIVSIPLYPSLKNSEVDRIINAIKEVVK